jgi:hypothetical protein
MTYHARFRPLAHRQATSADPKARRLLMIGGLSTNVAALEGRRQAFATFFTPEQTWN